MKIKNLSIEVSRAMFYAIPFVIIVTAVYIIAHNYVFSTLYRVEPIISYQILSSGIAVTLALSAVSFSYTRVVDKKYVLKIRSIGEQFFYSSITLIIGLILVFSSVFLINTNNQMPFVREFFIYFGYGLSALCAQFIFEGAKSLAYALMYTEDYLVQRGVRHTKSVLDLVKRM